MRHERRISVKISPTTHAAHTAHTALTRRSEALSNGLKDRNALDMMGHRNRIYQKHVKQSRRSEACNAQIGQAVRVRYVQSGRYVRRVDALCRLLSRRLLDPDPTLRLTEIHRHRAGPDTAGALPPHCLASSRRPSAPNHGRLRGDSEDRGWRCDGRCSCGVRVAEGQVREGVLEFGRADDLDVGVESADSGGQAGP